MNASPTAQDPNHPCNYEPQPATLRCAHCREVFDPPFAEFFYRDANGPFGWRRWCKACYSEAPSIRARELQRAAAKARRDPDFTSQPAGGTCER